MDAEITPDEVESLLEDGDGLRIVDIRPPAAFARGHIPGSVNVPFAELPTRVAEFADAERIVTVCPHGKSSVQAARLIASYEGTTDARVESMAGGLEAWTGRLETDGENGRAGPGDGTPESPF
jgi:rhodanese-related sulfurtransferase